MSRIDLPITDYVGDLTSVLDQAIRICQASIDVLTELGYLSSCMQMITLLQCIKCARWPTDYPLSILPGVSVEPPADKNLPPRLQDFAAQSEACYQKTLKALRLPPATMGGFQKAANMIPSLEIDVRDVTAVSLALIMNRQNKITDRDAKIYAPRFPKPQQEGWFVLLCKEHKDEIIAIKRIVWSTVGYGKGKSSGPQQSKFVARAELKFPDEGTGILSDGRKFDIWVVSDGYVGMVYKMNGVEIPDAPKVVNNRKEKQVEKAINQGGPA
jgi:antiviral helicase SLH1